jgi:GAF domain-containing protein
MMSPAPLELAQWIPSQPPPDETLRLEVLRQYAVLDTLPEQALDDLTALAPQICGTPIAAISLVDEHRQWFKARVGLEMAETPRDLAFCAHALHHRDLFIVSDAKQDERFARNTLVTGEPGICFTGAHR